MTKPPPGFRIVERPGADTPVELHYREARAFAAWWRERYGTDHYASQMPRKREAMKEAPLFRVRMKKLFRGRVNYLSVADYNDHLQIERVKARRVKP